MKNYAILEWHESGTNAKISFAPSFKQALRAVNGAGFKQVRCAETDGYAHTQIQEFECKGQASPEKYYKAIDAGMVGDSVFFMEDQISE